VNQFFHYGIARACIRALAAAGCFPLDGCKIADIGCGSGTWLLDFVQWGADPAQLAGIDLLEDRIEAARRRIPTAGLVAGSASRLPWASESFDVVSQFMLFTSVLSGPMKQAVAQEMLRVLKPGGIVLWYDFRCNNPRNDQVRGIKAREIRALFHPCSVRLAKVTLAPPIARLAVRIAEPIAFLLESISLLRTHYVGVIRKPEGPAGHAPQDSQAGLPILGVD
jgi:ubiquinone/menaquinone biosynthesis C-methylase UbiE